MKAESGSEKVHVHILDMSVPRAVHEFTAGYQGPVDILVNNAGAKFVVLIPGNFFCILS